MLQFNDVLVNGDALQFNDVLVKGMGRQGKGVQGVGDKGASRGEQ